MGYRELYHFAQNLGPKVSRNILRDKAVELAGSGAVRVFRDNLNIEICRGYFLSAQNTNHRIVQQCGMNVIVLAQGLNKCWSRFVFVKELCHLFDSEGQFTATGEQFEAVTSDILISNPEPSVQYRAEVDGVWKALGLLCPTKYVDEVLRQKEAGHIDDYGIALQFRIPQKYIGHLSSRLFKINIDRILAE